MTRILKALLIAILVLLSVHTIMDYYSFYKNIYIDNEVTLEGPAVDKQAKFTTDVAKLIEYADELGYQLTFGEAWRHAYMQKYYVAHGLSWTMNSYHRKRLAVDLNLFIDGKYITTCEEYKILGEYWKSLDPDRNVWGGSWKQKDCPHFEKR
jgi:hypothetical protein